MLPSGHLGNKIKCDTYVQGSAYSRYTIAMFQCEPQFWGHGSVNFQHVIFVSSFKNLKL